MEIILDNESAIIADMQIIDRDVFRYLCKFTDYQTCVIGRKVRVSYGGMALDLSERTERRRSMDKVVNRTSKQIENSVSRLINAGLFERFSESGYNSNLILLRKKMADFIKQDSSAKNEDGSVVGSVVGSVYAQLMKLFYIENNGIEIIIRKTNSVDSGVVGSAFGTTSNISTTTNETEKPFAMSIDWQPSENELRMILFKSVGSKHKIEDIDARWLGEFVGYWFSMPGRLMTQRQWTAKFAANVIRYFSDPEMVARKFGAGGVSVGKQASYEANSRALPDWARLPRNDDELVGWAKRHGFGEAESGDGFMEFRAKLRIKINRRLEESNLAKVVW